MFAKYDWNEAEYDEMFFGVQMGVCFSIVFFEKKRGKIMQKLSILVLKKVVGGRSKIRRRVFKNNSYGYGNGSGGGAF